MNVLVVGSGGREHALCWKLKQSPLLGSLHCLPGSAAIAELAACPPIAQDDREGIAAYCAARGISLVVIGPEAPLAAGLADFLSERGLKVFGPARRGAELESSKKYAKDFMSRHGIPTAAYGSYSSAAEARAAVRANKKYPLVAKADGLAAGKGVRICANEAEALAAVEDFMERRVFGDAGSRVVLEEFLEGPEVSVMALVDGKSFLTLPFSRDHKRLLDGNAGPNTGGMGAVCPVRLPADAAAGIESGVLARFAAGAEKDGLAYRGLIYAGIMLTREGPKVLEFNVRFGDPETQAIMPVIKSDLLPLLLACAEGRLAGERLELTGETCVSVVVAAAGYPDAPEKGRPVSGLALAGNAAVFHAGTAAKDGGYVTAGGRVLSVGACGADAEEARLKAYAALARIHFEGMQYRRDIGL